MKSLTTTTLYRCTAVTYKYLKRMVLYHYDKFLKKWDAEVSSIPIDLVFITIDKDIETLCYSIESAKLYIKHPINRIVIVTRASTYFIEFCKKNNYVFLDEKEVMGYDKTRIPKLNGLEGHYYQRLLKWGYEKFCVSEYYLVLDSDTVFNYDRIFIKNGKTFFDYSDEHWKPYRMAHLKLMGYNYDSYRSFICHYMLFQKSKVKELKEYIEKKHNCRWDEAVIASSDFSHFLNFSEFETYGNFVLHNYKKEVVRRYWCNKQVTTIQKLIKNYPSSIRSVSCHSWAR